METNNIQVLIRFLKEENLYKVVINALKFYKKNYNYGYKKKNIIFWG